jgi:hypothetical protein
LRYELDHTLAQVAGAANAIRVLTDYLERNPNALITGKAPPTPFVPPAAEPAPAAPAAAAPAAAH